MERRLSARAVMVVVAASLLVGAAGTAVALTLTSVGVDRFSLFTAQTADSRFDLQEFDVKVKGLAKVDVEVELTNTDGANPHRANVTVQLLDAADLHLAEQTVDTGAVAPGGTWRHVFSFTGAGLTTSYASAFAVVDDSN